MRLSDLTGYDPITIQCHDNPDADALASGYGLYCFFRSRGKRVRLVYSGSNRIQKSNLRLMVEKLKLPVEHLETEPGSLRKLDGLLLTVDCQYGSGNVTGLTGEEIAVIDHHPWEKDAIPLSVVNPALGSCATLVWKLLREENFDIEGEANLSTALFYGLYADTNQFSELKNPLDRDMRDALKPDMGAIALFRNSNLSLRELEIAGIAMLRYSYNEEYEFAVIKAQPCDPNILGLISDFLLQVDAIKSCVVFNRADERYKFSVRSCIREVNAGELAAYLSEGIGSGGGHYEKAGGFIGLKSYEEKFPGLHPEGYFNNRMVEYFNSFELIYAESYEADLSAMKTYAKRRIPVGYVKTAELLPIGTPITIRTLEGDIDLTVEQDLYVMIGVGGEVHPQRRDRFLKAYRLLDEKYVCGETEYEPVIKDHVSGREIRLAEHARLCVPTGEVHIYAKPLEKGVKVFTQWDKNKYMLGKPGDYLAVSYTDPHDIYVVERSLFLQSYDLLEAGENSLERLVNT